MSPAEGPKGDGGAFVIRGEAGELAMCNLKKTRLPTGLVESPSLEILKIGLDAVLGNLL